MAGAIQPQAREGERALRRARWRRPAGLALTGLAVGCASQLVLASLTGGSSTGLASGLGAGLGEIGLGLLITVAVLVLE